VEKTITGVIVSVLALGAADVDRDDRGSSISPPSVNAEIAPPVQLTGELGGVRNLRLDAFGRGQPGQGQLRVPIPTDSATYEVIITKPGLPRSVPVAKHDAD
jgi:hypothetical protein